MSPFTVLRCFVDFLTEYWAQIYILYVNIYIAFVSSESGSLLTEIFKTYPFPAHLNKRSPPPVKTMLSAGPVDCSLNETTQFRILPGTLSLSRAKWRPAGKVLQIDYFFWQLLSLCEFF